MPTAVVSTVLVLLIFSVEMQVVPARHLRQVADSEIPEPSTSVSASSLVMPAVETPPPSPSLPPNATTPSPVLPTPMPSPSTPPNATTPSPVMPMPSPVMSPNATTPSPVMPMPSPSMPPNTTTPSPVMPMPLPVMSPNATTPSPVMPMPLPVMSPNATTPSPVMPTPMPSPSMPPNATTPSPVMSPIVVIPPPSLCPPELCTAVTRRDESFIRNAIQNNVSGICDCVCDTATGDTLLHEAAEFEAVSFASLMLDTPPGCDEDVQDAVGRSPLHDAADVCNTPMAFLFLTRGADAEKLDDDDMTPLCVVALADNTNSNCGGIVNHLVEFGADICGLCPTASGPALPFDVATDFIVKNIIAQNGGRRVEDGGTC